MLLKKFFNRHAIICINIWSATNICKFCFWVFWVSVELIPVPERHQWWTEEPGAGHTQYISAPHDFRSDPWHISAHDHPTPVQCHSDTREIKKWKPSIKKLLTLQFWELPPFLNIFYFNTCRLKCIFFLKILVDYTVLYKVTVQSNNA